MYLLAAVTNGLVPKIVPSPSKDDFSIKFLRLICGVDQNGIKQVFNLKIIIDIIKSYLLDELHDP